MHAGTSLDQIYAQKFGQDTPIPSMQLCIENVDQAGGCSYGYSCVYTDTISWASPTEPLPMIRDPRVVFDQLFGVGATPAERARAPRRGQAASSTGSRSAGRAAASKDLGAADRARLDRLPRRRPRDRAPHPEGRGAQQQRRGARAAGRAGRRARLVRRARQADVRPAGARVRVGHHARVLVQARPRRVEPRLSRRAASTAAFHSASHHGEREDRITRVREDQHATTSAWCRTSSSKLKNTPDGDGNLLDNTLVIYGSPMGDSNMHNHKRVPAVPRRPRRRRAEGRPAHQGRRRHADGQRDADACCTSSGSTT